MKKKASLKPASVSIPPPERKHPAGIAFEIMLKALSRAKRESVIERIELAWAQNDGISCRPDLKRAEPFAAQRLRLLPQISGYTARENFSL